MNIKMVKMGRDIDETRNHRIRGIVPTDAGEFLFMEICKGNRPNINYTNLSRKEYEFKYPYPEYVWISSCFRVDIPEDYYKNRSKDLKNYEKSFFNIPHTKEDIVKILNHFNKGIQDIELINDHNYIDKYCEEKGFYKLYDDRLKHQYQPLEILWYDFAMNGKTRLKNQYTCYSSSGQEYKEEMQEEGKIQDFINKYGKDTMCKLLDNYIEKEAKKISNKEFENIAETYKSEIFSNNVIEDEMEY